MKYFEALTQEQEIKARYRELARSHHPDRGGDPEIMKEINNQYEKVLAGHYQKAGKSLTEIEELLANDIAAAQAINAIVAFDDIKIELMGTWLWITGNTKPYKDILKQAKFRWAQAKQAWYWKPTDQRNFRRGRGTYDLCRIAEKYGSERIKSPLNQKQYQKIT